MNLQKIKNVKNEKGFTIVELLIVIVVIGILAAIVIVAYQGVTAKANKTDAQTAAATSVKKAEAYNADTAGGNGAYPTTPSNLSSAASTTTFSTAGSGIVYQGTAAFTAQPGAAKTINFYTCGTAGNAFGFWNYETKAVNYVYSGTAQGSGSATALPSSGCTFVAGP